MTHPTQVSCNASAGQAALQVETAEVQLDVIDEGIDELCSLEKYLTRTHPPYESAELLAVRSPITCRHSTSINTNGDLFAQHDQCPSQSMGKPDFPQQHVTES